MKLIELINEIDSLRYNQVPDDIKRKWVSDVEGMIINEVVLTHEMPEWMKENGIIKKYLSAGGRGCVYDAETDGEQELIVEAPYDSLYYWWLASKIDLAEADTERYQNDHQMFNDAYLTYQDYYNRTHMPIQKVRGFMCGPNQRTDRR